MKITISKLAVIILLISSILSCNEDPCDTCLAYENDKPPIANAGQDITIKYNTQTCSYETATLDGSLSSDPDGEIKLYKWNIIQPYYNEAAERNTVFAFTPTENKEYLIELFVLDQFNKYDRDTIKVTTENALLKKNSTVRLNLVEMAEIPNRVNYYGFLSGSKTTLLFSELIDYEYISPYRVMLFDLEKKKWREHYFLIPRVGYSSVIEEDNIFFMGGISGDNPSYEKTENSMELFNINSGTSSIVQLKESRYGGDLIYFNNKIFCIGGNKKQGNNYSPVENIEIYDINSKNSSLISFPKNLSSFTRYGNKLYFPEDIDYSNPTGSTRISIFDLETISWSFSILPIGTTHTQSLAASIGKNIYWVGKNPDTQNTSGKPGTLISFNSENAQSNFSCSPGYIEYPELLSKNNNLFLYSKFLYSNINDENVGYLYDSLTGNWSDCQLSFPRGTSFSYFFQNNGEIYHATEVKLYRVSF